jgi:actin-related protein
MNAIEKSGDAYVTSPLDSIFDSACFESVISKLLIETLRKGEKIETCQVFITEDIAFPPELRERLVYILLMKISVFGCFVANPLSLTAYSFRQSRAPDAPTSEFDAVCVLDCGCYHTRAQVVYEGFSIPETLVTSRVAGKALDDYLASQHALACHQSRDTEKGSHFFAISEASSSNLFTQIKEALCSVAYDFENLESVPTGLGSTMQDEVHDMVERLSSHHHHNSTWSDDEDDDNRGEKEAIQQQPSHVQKEFQTSLFMFSDRSTVDIGRDQYLCGEGLFHPSLINLPQERSVIDCIWTSIDKAVNRAEDPCLRLHLLQNIVVTGGTSMMTGFIARLDKELNLKIQQNMHLFHEDSSEVVPVVPTIRVHVLGEQRQWSAWQGGSQYTNRNLNEIRWITKSDYADLGNDAVHQHCVL